MFEMRDIEKRFDAVVALNKASLKTEPGEIRALLGSNGSGKSTMIKILAGVYDSDSGEILDEGKPINIQSGMSSKQLGIATAFQELSLIPSMSVIDNLVLGHEPVNKFGRVDRKAVRQQVQDLLDRFEIVCDLDAYVQTLMPSTQTMLEVAKAVSLNPRLLLLDEVTAPLHFDEAEVLFKIIRELKEEGMSILYVTHRMSEVFELCDHVSIMRGGETVKEAATSELDLNEIVFHMTGQYPEVRVERKGAPSEGDETDDSNVLLDVRDYAVYPTVWDVSMKVRKGEIIGIAGLQGHGQPEFIRSLLGVLPATSGSAEYNGKSIKFKSPVEAVRNGMGFVSGDRKREAIFPVRSIKENLSAGIIAKGNIGAYLTPKKLRKFSTEAIEKYRIVAGSLANPVSSLSGGNQQKIVLSRWIAMNPTLLLLDDPTKGVDVHSRREIHDILQKCADEGMTIIMSSSEYEELFDVADRIYVFYEGHISDMLEGERKTEELLVAAMLGMNEQAESAGEE